MACHAAPSGWSHRLPARPRLSLAAVGARLGAEALAAFVRDPQAGKPGTTMPGLLGPAPEEAAMRETLEEANLAVEELSLLGVYTRVEPGVVVIVYTARAIGEASAGDEAAEVRWFARHEIPWDELAFDTTEWALREFTEGAG